MGYFVISVICIDKVTRNVKCLKVALIDYNVSRKEKGVVFLDLK